MRIACIRLGLFEVLLLTEFDIDLVQAEHVNVTELVAFFFLYGFLRPPSYIL